MKLNDVKGKGHPIRYHRKHSVRVELWLYLFLISALDGGWSSTSHPSLDFPDRVPVGGPRVH